MHRFVLSVSALWVASAACSSPAKAVVDAGVEAAAYVPDYDAKGCQTPIGGEIPGAVCITSLKGKVVDENGKPIADLVTTACGDGCTFGKTDASGVASMAVHRYMHKAAMMLHGRSTYATYYAAITGEGDIDKGTLILPRMPNEGVTIPEDGVATTLLSGDVKLTLPQGVKVAIDKMELEEPSQQQYRALSVPLEKAPAFVDATSKIVALYALTPFATTFDPGVGVSIPNRTNLAAGAAVEFFSHGTEADDKYGTFASFTKVAEGHVSADGSVIQTDDGQRLSELSWLGVRLKP